MIEPVPRTPRQLRYHNIYHRVYRTMQNMEYYIFYDNTARHETTEYFLDANRPGGYKSSIHGALLVFLPIAIKSLLNIIVNVQKMCKISAFSICNYILPMECSATVSIYNTRLFPIKRVDSYNGPGLGKILIKRSFYAKRYKTHDTFHLQRRYKIKYLQKYNYNFVINTFIFTNYNRVK